jgi:hypothetical protein
MKQLVEDMFQLKYMCLMNSIISKFYLSFLTGILVFGITQKSLKIEVFYLNGYEITQQTYASYIEDIPDIYNRTENGIYLSKNERPDFLNSIYYSSIAVFIAGLLLLGLPMIVKRKKPTVLFSVLLIASIVGCGKKENVVEKTPEQIQDSIHAPEKKKFEFGKQLASQKSAAYFSGKLNLKYGVDYSELNDRFNNRILVRDFEIVDISKFENGYLLSIKQDRALFNVRMNDTSYKKLNEAFEIKKSEIFKNTEFINPHQKNIYLLVKTIGNFEPISQYHIRSYENDYPERKIDAELIEYSIAN